MATKKNTDKKYTKQIKEKPFISTYEVRLWVTTRDVLYKKNIEESKKQTANYNSELSELIDKAFLNHWEFNLLDSDMALVQLDLFPPVSKY